MESNNSRRQTFKFPTGNPHHTAGLLLTEWKLGRASSRTPVVCFICWWGWGGTDFACRFFHWKPVELCRFEPEFKTQANKRRKVKTMVKFSYVVWYCFYFRTLC